MLVDYIASTGSAYQCTKLFIHRCLRVCFDRLPCSCVRVRSDSGFCLHLQRETRYSPQVQLLIWSQQLFSPARLHPSTLLPPTPPSIFLMLFQLQTFRLRGISLATHTECTYIYTFFICLLPPRVFPNQVSALTKTLSNSNSLHWSNEGRKTCVAETK